MIAAGGQLCADAAHGKFLIPELHKLKRPGEFREAAHLAQGKAGTPPWRTFMFTPGGRRHLFALGWSYMLEGQFSLLYVYLFARFFGPPRAFVDDFRKVASTRTRADGPGRCSSALAAAVVFWLLMRGLRACCNDGISPP